jgi:hypothetical protein
MTRLVTVMIKTIMYQMSLTQFNPRDKSNATMPVEPPKKKSKATMGMEKVEATNKAKEVAPRRKAIDALSKELESKVCLILTTICPSLRLTNLEFYQPKKVCPF